MGDSMSWQWRRVETFQLRSWAVGWPKKPVKQQPTEQGFLKKRFLQPCPEWAIL